MRATRFAVIGLLAVAALKPLSAQQNYSSSTAPTTSAGSGAWPGLGYVVGQSFTASGSSLYEFGFYAASNWSGNATFQALLFAMSGPAVVGSALYSSPLLSYTSVTTGWLDFLTGSVSLTPGNVYMALLAPVSVTGGLAVMDVGTESGDAYPGGSGGYTYGGLPFTESALHGATWTSLGSLTGKPGQDFALRLQYGEGGGWQAAELDELVVTPEPSSIALVATGLLALVGAARWSRKRKAALQGASA
jgi:hypothetical protein